MISISKPASIPSVLSGIGQAENMRNKQSYDSNPLAEIKIKDGIYNHRTVKKILKEAQHSKCCFCEKVQNDEDGTVDHYRPKCGYKSKFKKGEKLKKPGYYWLCYTWTNLYFVCNVCNRAKANYFPLTNENRRAKSHHDDITLETPYILDPAGEKDPRAHISFDYQFIRGTSNFGQQTIEICTLDRAALDEERRELIDIIKTYIDILELPLNDIVTPEIIQAVRRFLIDCQKPSAKFSATAIDYIRRRNIQVV